MSTYGHFLKQQKKTINNILPRAEAGPVWLRYQRRPVYSAPCVGPTRFGLWDALGITRLTGKLEALAILLQKLKSEGRRVLILSQMVLMLDILEMFLNFHYLTYIRIDENANSEQRQVGRKSILLFPFMIWLG